MTRKESIKLGHRLGIQASMMGLIIAQLFMTWINRSDGWIDGFLWFMHVSYQLALVVGIIIFLWLGRWWGAFAALQIVQQERDPGTVGVLCGILTLLSIAFLSGWTEFIVNYLDHSAGFWSLLKDYVWKPFIWITLIGFIPSIALGVQFGERVRRNLAF